jgi:hypothetical protein
MEFQMKGWVLFLAVILLNSLLIADICHASLVWDPYFVFYQMNLSPAPLLAYSVEFHLRYDLIFRLIVKLELNEFQLNEDRGGYIISFCLKNTMWGAFIWA